jgi:hypothetical protein
MPRYKLSDTMSPALREEIVSAIANELRSAPALGGPLVYETEIPQTGTYHVFVVWQRWRDVPSEYRSSIILDAYQRVDPSMASHITIATGITMEEAIELGLLPYQVVAMRKKGDPVPEERLTKALLDEGAVETAAGVQLRFPTKELADQAYMHLVDKVPGPYWAVEHTIPSGHY